MPCAPFYCRSPHRSRDARARARLRAVVLAAGVLLLAPAAQATDPEAAAPGAAAREPLSHLIAGLLAYTNWPVPLPAVRLCTWGQGHGIDDIQHSAHLGSAQRAVAVQHGVAAADAAVRCDAVYVSAGAPAAALDLPRALMGRPVLVIGEGARFCAAGGMFCVDSDGPALRFHANLDAIARSGLRVNPQVLRIARNIPGSGS
jgi:YfiR/HmsC-like